MSDVQVSDHPEVERYEISVDGRRAGLAAYELEGDVITFTHTEIDDAYEGQGLGSQLARSRSRRRPVTRSEGATALPLHPRLDQAARGLPGPGGPGRLTATRLRGGYIPAIGQGCRDRVAHSHHRPRIGSSSGTNPYPMP